MTRWKIQCGAIVPLVLAALAGAANAREASIETHSAAPIDITANEAEIVSSKCLAIWRGAAEALQGKTRLRADTISVYSHPKGESTSGRPDCGGTDRIEADGNVFYVTADQRARGDHAVYTAATDEIVITGDVIVVQGKNVARGDKLVFKVSTRQARMESNVVGAGRSGRVRGVFFPEKSATADKTDSTTDTGHP